MPGRHNKKQICNFPLGTVRTTQNAQTAVGCGPMCRLSHMCLCHVCCNASRMPRKSTTHSGRTCPRCCQAVSVAAALVRPTFTNDGTTTNHQEHETPKRQLVDHGSVSQQNNADEINRERLPERVHEPKFTLMHELGKRNVHNKRTRRSMQKERDRNPKNYPPWAHAKFECAQKRASNCARRYYRMAPSTTIVVQLLDREACSQTKKSRINTWKASSPKRPRTTSP